MSLRANVTKPTLAYHDTDIYSTRLRFDNFLANIFAFESLGEKERQKVKKKEKKGKKGRNRTEKDFGGFSSIQFSAGGLVILRSGSAFTKLLKNFVRPFLKFEKDSL